MTKDIIIKCIEASGENKELFPFAIHKFKTIGLVNNSFELSEPIEKVYNSLEESIRLVEINKIISIFDDAVIFSDNDKTHSYRVAFKDGDKYKLTDTICDTVESALIYYLCEKNKKTDMVKPIFTLLGINTKK